MSEELELLFIDGDFLNENFPKDKRYLLKYFKTKIQRTYVKYYLTFGNHKNFVDHTGCRCTIHTLEALKIKLRTLEQIRSVAKNNFDIDLVAKIESGKYRYRGKKNNPS